MNETESSVIISAQPGFFAVSFLDEPSGILADDVIKQAVVAWEITRREVTGVTGRRRTFFEVNPIGFDDLPDENQHILDPTGQITAPWVASYRSLEEFHKQAVEEAAKKKAAERAAQIAALEE
jgi:hypothetical protein